MSRTSKEGIREAGIVAKDAPKVDQNLYGVSITRLDLLYTNPCTLITLVLVSTEMMLQMVKRI